MAKCPKCDKTYNSISKLKCEAGVTSDMGSIAIHVAIFSCSNVNCGAILGVTPDPVAMKKDIAREVVRLLKK